MIKWLRDKFASAISFFFILSVILVTVSGGIAGFAVGKSFGYYDNYSGIGCFIGLIIGCFFGIVCGILTFGYFATIIHISETIDKENVNKQNSEASIGNENKQKSDASTENVDYSQSWFCEKCGTANNNNLETCKKCGAKKSKILV